MPRCCRAALPILLAASLFDAAIPAAIPAARAQGLRTVVVPADGGVVVAPRSAPPRLVARPPQARTTATVTTQAAPRPTMPATGGFLGDYTLPALSLIPLAAAAALFATGNNGSGGGGGSGTVAPARTQ